MSKTPIQYKHRCFFTHLTADSQMFQRSAVSSKKQHLLRLYVFYVENKRPVNLYLHGRSWHTSDVSNNSSCSSCLRSFLINHHKCLVYSITNIKIIDRNPFQITAGFAVKSIMFNCPLLVFYNYSNNTDNINKSITE